MTALGVDMMGCLRARISLVGSILAMLLLAGCSAGQAGDATPAPTAAVPATSTVAAVASAIPSASGGTAVVPGMPVGLCTEDCVVVDFQVWQDFMPSRNATGAPLHASVTLDLQWPQKITADAVQGKITLLRASGDQLVTADLQLAQQADDLGLQQPGPQRVLFTMTPQTIATKLTEGEMLHGTVTLTLGRQTRTVDLPEASLLFTH